MNILGCCEILTASKSSNRARASYSKSSKRERVFPRPVSQFFSLRKEGPRARRGSDRQRRERESVRECVCETETHTHRERERKSTVIYIYIFISLYTAFKGRGI